MSPIIHVSTEHARLDDIPTFPKLTASQISVHSASPSLYTSLSRIPQPTLPVSRPTCCAAALRCTSCSLLVASPCKWCGEDEDAGCTFVPVVAVDAETRCRGVYGRYRCPPTESGEGEGERFGVMSGCAVNESVAWIAAAARWNPEPAVRPMEVTGKLSSRLGAMGVGQRWWADHGDVKQTVRDQRVVN